MRRSIGGLMDESDPTIDARIREVLARAAAEYGVRFHGLRHRNAGNKLMIEVHLLFPENAPLVRAHEEATLIEKKIHEDFPGHTEIITHLEPIEGHDEIHEKLLKQEKSSTGGK